MTLPKDMYARAKADEQKIKAFTNAIHRRDGSASLEKILIEVSDLGSDEIRAMITLIESEATEFDNLRGIMDHALSDKKQGYQSTIRILKDNGWISTTRSSSGLEFVLTEQAYQDIPWL